MHCLALILYSMLLPDSAFTGLPAPLNVSVISVNFHHVMRWDPGPGTPPGTQYMVFTRVYGDNYKQELNSTTTSLKLELSNNFIYLLTVQAYCNQTLSPVSDKYTFSPYRDTTIGPPEVSLAGCGNCIQINMSLPEADRSSGIDDIQKFYYSDFRVVCKRGKTEVGSYIIQNKSFTLHNLNRGEEYCVQVHTEIFLNKNTEPSSLKCIFTSTVEQRKDPVVLGVVAVLLIFFVGVFITIMSCLYYTGFLCKLKDLPTVLMALVQGYTLTPEETIPDPVSINSQMEKQRQHNEPTMQFHAMGNEDEDDEEEEEEQINVYMDRAARCSTDESLCLGSGNMLMHSEPAAAADCGSLTERLSAEVELSDADDGVTLVGLDEDLVKAAGTKVSLMPEEGHIRLQGHVTGGEGEEKEDEMKKEKVFDSSGDVNLFSVTLAALTVGEEEEEEEEHNANEPFSNFLKLPDLEPLQRVQKWSLSNTDSQTQSDDQTTVGLMKDTHEDFTETGYEGLRANTSGCINTQHEEKQEGEEDDEIIFEYMAHT
ncbi:cytokine receptor family member b1 [Hippoglossus hippoglossus]|uniref:cytokine receptor family member b1 n=1 Tax=Hippoglossus hippoglossus TaxID=8267 RepID=UPI00148C817D|nr:cytokine receptor family member b1 [Hippoglossus hippoglossus]